MANDTVRAALTPYAGSGSGFDVFRLDFLYDRENEGLAAYTLQQVVLLSQKRDKLGSKGITVDILSIHMGCRYPNRCNRSDMAAEENLPPVQNPQQWTGEPGTRVPHVFLERKGEEISSLALVQAFSGLLLT